MALPGSGTMTSAQWLAEFGVSAPKNASDFYRGGAIVPDVPANASVPTSGTMTAANFYGASNIDIIPAAMDWEDLVTDLGTTFTNFNQTFSGINTTITIKITFTGTASLVSYRKNSGSYTGISSGSTFTVVNGDTLNFRITGNSSAGTVNVLNNSNGDSVIDTFSYAP